MKCLFLPGSHTTHEIWDQVLPLLPEAITTVSLRYPHELTQAAKNVEDIASWVTEKVKNQAVDFMIGHSMGGLVALILAAKQALLLKGLILVESNLRPAADFYRNLLLPKHRPLLGDALMAMIRSEDPFYSDSLKQVVKQDFDFTPYVSQVNCPIYGIYGDRGFPDHPERIRYLNLDEATVQKIRFRFIRDACHMPMLENPEALARLMLECLDECQ